MPTPQPKPTETLEAVALVRGPDGVRVLRLLADESQAVERSEPTLLALALEKAKRLLFQAEERSR